MLEFNLFRVKVVRPSQQDIFGNGMTNADAIAAVIHSRPSAELRRGHYWHVGNVEQIDPSGYYFAIGRTTRSTIPLFDEKAGNFVELEFESAPYTHTFVDIALGVCGIAKKSQLSPTTEGIARQLGRLFNQTEAAIGASLKFEIGPISDPEGFIEQLRHAYAVTSFGITFSRPNPFDVNTDFQLPMERTLQAANGTEGSATLKGSNLDPGPLEELARSAAATGNDAFARLYPNEGGRSVRRRLRTNAATVTHEDLEHDTDARRSVLERIRNAYVGIRRASDGESA